MRTPARVNPDILSRHIERLFPSHSFARKLAVLTGGTTIGQLLGLLATPFIARIYTPADYGILGIYISTLGLVVPIAALRFESGVPAARSDSEAAHLIVLALISVTCSGALISILLLLMRGQMAHLAGIRPLIPFLWLIPVGVTLSGIYQALTFWCIRRQAFKILSATKISQSAGLVSMQLLLGLAYRSPIGLLVGHILGQSSGITWLLRWMFSDRKLFRYVDRRTLMDVANRNNRFPKLSVAALLLETSSVHLSLLLFAASYGVTVMGWISLVANVISAPFAVLSLNVGQVYFAELAQLKLTNPAEMRRSFLRRLRQISVFGLGLTIIVITLGWLLIPTVFGAPWKNSVLCLGLWAPVMLLSFVASPFGWVLDGLQRQDLHLVRGALRLVLPAAAVGAAHLFRLGWIPALALLSGAIALGYIVYAWLSWVAVDRFAPGEEQLAEGAAALETQDASSSFIF